MIILDRPVVGASGMSCPQKTAAEWDIHTKEARITTFGLLADVAASVSRPFSPSC